jgi:hypothetical protein
VDWLDRNDHRLTTLAWAFLAFAAGYFTHYMVTL